MTRQRYTSETKKAILEAAIAARGQGKSWREAFDAAKAAGYNGSAPGLVQMLRNASARKGSPAKVGRPRGPGRPPKAAPAAAAATSGSASSLQAAIDAMVRERVSAAIGRAIEA